MEKIAYYRQELAKRRKQTEESYKAAMSAKGPPAASQTKQPLTVAHDFHFETDSRVKTHGMATRQDDDVKDFASTLRSERNKSPVSVFYQGSHRLEKYLNMQDCLEKSLNIKFALKSTKKTFKGLEMSLNSTFFCRN